MANNSICNFETFNRRGSEDITDGNNNGVCMNTVYNISLLSLYVLCTFAFLVLLVYPLVYYEQNTKDVLIYAFYTFVLFYITVVVLCLINLCFEKVRIYFLEEPSIKTNLLEEVV